MRPKPGSPVAIAPGCTCSLEANSEGEGELQPDGTRMFFPDLDCPIHGFDAIREALESGEAEIVEPEDDRGPAIH
jgi:hypothetical protein